MLNLKIKPLKSKSFPQSKPLLKIKNKVKIMRVENQKGNKNKRIQK
jgi:hypothetical protein